MSVATKTIKIDLWRALLEPIKVVQREAAGRTLAFQITDGGQAYDLTGKVVTFYATKPDGTIVYNACTITDAATGKISYLVTSQTVVVAGALACTLTFTASGALTRTQPFVVTVIASPDYTLAVESADEFTALTELAGQIADHEARIDVTEAAITSLASGSPAGTYANLAALIAANPNHAKIYITLDDGKWCYYNGSAFVAGSVYQATSDAVFISLAASLGLSVSILNKLIFLGEFPEIDSVTADTISNELGAGSFYSISWSYPHYFIVHAAISGLSSNTELLWALLVSYSSLTDFDYDNIFVKYTATPPYHIKMLAIAIDGTTFTVAEKKLLYKAFELPIFREDVFNTNGVLKQNRHLAKAAYANLIENPLFVNGDNWTLGAQWSVVGGKAYCNDPTMQLSTMTQTYVFEVGATYRLGFKVDNYVSGIISARIDWDVAQSGYVAGNSWQEVTFTYNGPGANPNEIMFKPWADQGFVGKISFVELVKL